MKQHDEDAIIEQMERDAENAEAWEDDPAPAQPTRGLQALISVRLDSQTADVIRDLAEQRGTSFSALLREWVEERLTRELGSEEARQAYEPQQAGVATIPRDTATSTGGARPPALTHA